MLFSFDIDQPGTISLKYSNRLPVLYAIPIKLRLKKFSNLHLLHGKLLTFYIAKALTVLLLLQPVPKSVHRIS